MADELPGIPTVPSGSPKEIVGWMTAVRNRLLKLTGNQFTDAQATALKALLGNKSTSTVTVTNTVAGMIFLTTPYQFYSGGDKIWTSLSVKDAGVPIDAAAVGIECSVTSLHGASGPIARALARIDSTKGIGSSPEADTFYLGRNYIGIAFGTTIHNEVLCQSWVPIRSDGTFDFTVIGCANSLLRIVGYIPGASA